MNRVARYFNIIEAADYLHYAPQSLYDYVSHRMIPHLKAGGRNLFRISELEVWLNTGADYAAASAIISNRLHRVDYENINLSVDDVALYLHLETSTIYKLKYSDRIPYIKMRKPLLFRTVEIDKWLDFGGTYEIAIMIMAQRHKMADNL